MTEQQARVWLLEMIRERLGLFRQGADKCQISGEEDALEFNTGDFTLYGAQMGWSAAEVGALCRRLIREGYVRPYRDDRGMDRSTLQLRGAVQHVWMEDLADPGLVLVGVLDSPQERLAASMDAFAEAIRKLEGVAPEERERVATMFEREGKTFARNLAPAAALELVKATAAYYGIPAP